MKVPPARLITIEVTKIGAFSIPIPMPIPVDSIRDKKKKMKKTAFFDLVLCCPN
jgi:hypothetical protein